MEQRHPRFEFRHVESSILSGAIKEEGGIADSLGRNYDDPSPAPRPSEEPAHECGHTWQITRLGLLYWPIGSAFILFREGPHWWNRFENQVSDIGQFGGIVNGSVHPRLMSKMSIGLHKHH